jgi:hypothetical protein
MTLENRLFMPAMTRRAIETILSPDLLHMNNWSYPCYANNLASALTASFIETAALIKPQGQRTANAGKAPQAVQVSATC